MSRGGTYSEPFVSPHVVKENGGRSEQFRIPFEDLESAQSGKLKNCECKFYQIRFSRLTEHSKLTLPSAVTVVKCNLILNVSL